MNDTMGYTTEVRTRSLRRSSQISRNNRGLGCDHGGCFLWCTAPLRKDVDGSFRARLPDEHRQVFSSFYGNEAEWDSRIGSVNRVARALNSVGMARPLMAAVLMRLNSDRPVGFVDVSGVLVNAGFNPDEPRDERRLWTNGGNNGNDAEAARHWRPFSVLPIMSPNPGPPSHVED